MDTLDMGGAPSQAPSQGAQNAPNPNQTMSNPNGDAGQRGAQNAPQNQGQTSQIDAEFLQALNSKFDEYDKALGESAKDKEILSKLKSALSDEQPRDKEGKWIDKHLARIMEARQQGGSMPITEDLVVAMQQQMDETTALKSQLEEALRTIKQLSNPQTHQDQNVYGTMDNITTRTIERIYGEVRPEIHDLVSRTLSDRLRQTQKEAPEVWERIRLDPQLQKKVVLKAVSDIVPPQAMQMMRQKHEDEQPLTMQTIRQAFEEAQSIEDPEMRAKAKEIVRQKMWAMRNPLTRGTGA